MDWEKKIYYWISNVYDDLFPCTDKQYDKRHILMKQRLITMIPLITDNNINFRNFTVMSFAVDKCIFCISYVDELGNVAFHSIGPPLNSMDGEYRRRFITNEQVDIVISENPEIFDFIESLIEIPDIVAHCIGNICDIHYIENITKSRLGITMYIIAWLINQFYDRHNLLENHVNNTYIVGDKNRAVSYTKVLEKYGHEYINKLIYDIRIWGISLVPSLSFNELGQKIIPISFKEFEEFGDISHPIWREIYCNRLVGDLIINNITTSFSLFVGMFTVQMDKMLFNNASMNNKMHQSNLIRDAMNKVDSIVKPLTMFDTLAEAFDNPKEIAEKNIIMSDYALVFVSKYVGRTYFDMPNITRNSLSKDFIGPVFDNIKVFKKYIFEIMYSLSACNNIGIIHGDLHLNNCTIDALNYKINSKDLVKYIVGEDEYIFDYTGAVSCIIDFSRAILNPASHDVHINSLRTSIMNSLSYYFPKYMEQNSTKVEIAILQYAQQMFWYFTVFDLYVFFSKMQQLVKGYNVPDDITNFIDTIYNLVKVKLFDFEILYEKIVPVDEIHPIVDIIKQSMSEFSTINHHPDGSILDVFSLNYPLKFSLSSCESWPDYLKEIRSIRSLDKDKLDDMKGAKLVQNNVKKCQQLLKHEKDATDKILNTDPISSQ